MLENMPNGPGLDLRNAMVLRTAACGHCAKEEDVGISLRVAPALLEISDGSCGTTTKVGGK